MTEAIASPSPWSLSGDIIVGAAEPRANPKVEPYGHVLAKLCWDFDGDRNANGDLPWKTAEANGRLMVAAPVLLAACRAAYGMFQQSPLNADDDWTASQLAQQLRDAIRQATKGTACSSSP